jgi:hypothetical protein
MRKVGLTWNVDENKLVSQFLPGMFMIMKDLVALGALSFQLPALGTGFLKADA